jgi:hypothetical protein
MNIFIKEKKNPLNKKEKKEKKEKWKPNRYSKD